MKRWSFCLVMASLLALGMSIGGVRSAAAYELKVKVWIDGESQLVIQKNSVYWHNLQGTAPGYEGQAKPLPTYLTTDHMGTVSWHPTGWSNGTTGVTTSAPFTKLNLPLAAAGQTVIKHNIAVRGNVAITQQPTAANDYTLILDFEDLAQSGADWYEVSLEVVPGKLLDCQDVGALPGKTGGQVFALNAKGQATGTSGGRAFLWDPKVGQMQDLGAPLDSLSSSGIAINSKGQVTGALQKFNSNASTPFFWDPGSAQMQDIPTLGGKWATVVKRSLNDKGQVCGWSEVTPGGAIHAFLWDRKNGVQDLGNQPGWTTSIACGINNKGQVCGWALTPAGQRAFLWDPKTGYHDLGTLPGGSFSVAGDINSKGQVCGYADTSEGQQHAFFWDPKQNGGQIQDLGTLPEGNFSSAFLINSKGQVAGRAVAADLHMHAFFWDPKVREMQDMGPMLNSEIWPQSMNSKGQVVGYTQAANGEAHAFFWDPKVGEMQDLGTPRGGFLNVTFDINAKGRICGYVTESGPTRYAVMWSP